MAKSNLIIKNVNLEHSENLVLTSYFYCDFFGGDLYEK